MGLRRSNSESSLQVFRVASLVKLGAHGRCRVCVGCAKVSRGAAGCYSGPPCCCWVIGDGVGLAPSS